MNRFVTSGMRGPTLGGGLAGAERTLVALAEAIADPLLAAPGGGHGRGSSPMTEGDTRDVSTLFAAAWRATHGTRAKVLLAYDHFHTMVYVTASRVLRDPAEAEDVTQTVFETLARKLGSVRDPASVGAFLKTCALRRAMAVDRRRRRWRAKPAAPFVAPSQTREPDAELVAAVRQLMARLTELERVVVVLRYVERYELSEIAAFTATSVSTVQRRLRSARDRLRREVAQAPNSIAARCLATLHPEEAPR
ncbi:MAG: sigma-70 family RNA polymerase sigma factor [Myxococcota bacterium]